MNQKQSLARKQLGNLTLFKKVFFTKSKNGNKTLAVLQHIYEIVIIIRATENGAQQFLLF